MLVILFVILAQLCPGTSHSDFYDVPAYYGHFSRRYFDPNFILAATFARVQFHFAVDATYDNRTLYFAKPDDHCVYSYSLTSQLIQPFVGQCGISGNAIGSKQLAKFNSISSVAYFKRPSQRLMSQLQAQKVVIVANSSCEISSCLLSSDYPPLSMENLRYQSEVSLFEDQASTQEFMYLADTANHCIKVLSFSDSRVSVVAGKCGEAGFLDGPINYNRLNTPTNIGVSRKGVIYFFDSGNQYIRIVDLSGKVVTLEQGACRLFDSGRVVEGYEFRQMLCYQDWIEGMTQGATNHYFDPTILNICSSQSSQCAYQQ